MKTKIHTRLIDEMLRYLIESMPAAGGPGATAWWLHHARRDALLLIAEHWDVAMMASLYLLAWENNDPTITIEDPDDPDCPFYLLVDRLQTVASHELLARYGFCEWQSTGHFFNDKIYSRFNQEKCEALMAGMGGEQ